MITADRIATALTPSFLTTVEAGEARPVTGLELVEVGATPVVRPGDLAVVVGARSAADLLTLIPDVAGCAGLLVRQGLAAAAEVVAACREHGLPLIALTDDTALTAAVTVLREVVDRTVRTDGADVSPDSVYTGLFALADVLGTVLDAPVTIEDARSRVLAYSTGQQGVDDARTSTIIGREVPREVRDHFRALGVFRRIMHSDEPVFVPAGDTGVKPRLVIPVRAGGEWLGSVWAVVAAEPPADVLARARAAAEVLALDLLRLRARGELHRRLARDRVRAVLLGESDRLSTGIDTGIDTGPGPWRAVVLDGPRSDLDPEERITVWAALAQRHGWRTPVLCDLEDLVVAVVTDHPSTAAGSWPWLRELVVDQAQDDGTVAAAAGGPTERLDGLPGSVAQARELRTLPGGVRRPVRCVEDDWAALVVARAVRGVAAHAPVSPVTRLLESHRDHHNHRDHRDLVVSLGVILDHWGDHQRAARALGVHPNTVRNRIQRLTTGFGLDLDDPEARLALRLEVLSSDR